ncbi:MAG: asparagine synthase (glutamine-hydrolyzing), partial [Candidatus Nealsonbacteria bacterium]|nr:asparagine synthase (glutamine-hydrolyzing) [Candidatus Nealsonbacteria bacterium]
MCGIAGVFCIDEARPSSQIVRGMVEQLRHRGPDAAGVAVDGPAALGHARLSIIDLAHGSQPMHNRDHSLTLTFNGEIFNYVELRETLQRLGHTFQTQSDTEVILHAYEQYGQECVEHFNGQWAFAIWDARRRELFLSRDRLGIRPLFYTQTGATLLFASEIKALLTHKDVSRAIDPQGLNQLFTFWSTLPPRTVFRGIRELPPGHNLCVEASQIRTWRYWDLEYAPENHAKTDDEWAEQLLELLEDSTRLRLRSDVPVGAYLSGGLDSSVTTALAQQYTSNHLRTFSVTFGDAEFDESQYQRQVVDFLNTDHQAVHCDGDTIAQVFPDVIRHTEKPVLRTAPAPLYVLSRLVHNEGFKVVLTGEGSDEMLGGYDIFKEAKVRRFCAAQPDSAFRSRLFERLYPYMPNLQAQSLAYRKAFFRVRPEELGDPFFSHLPRWELTSRLGRFFSRDVRAELEEDDPYADLRAMLPADYSEWPPLCQAQFLETAVLMPGYILSSQGDRMAMAHSVEGRFPFLDHRIAELAARMPPRIKMKGLNEKYILKRATRHLVPPEVLQRTKQPYRSPDAASFFDVDSQSARADYVDELLSPARIRDDGVFHG